MTNGKFYVDASVIVGLFLDDFDVEPTFALVAEPSALTYSDFGLGEVIAGLSARARAVRSSDVDTSRMIEAASAYLMNWQTCQVISADVAKAVDLVTEPALALKFPDAIHLAIADRLSLPLLTNDRRQHRAAAAASIDSQLLPTR